MLKLLKITVSIVYGLAVAIRNKLYDMKILQSKEINNVVTIAFGNLTVGGTGKTPHSEFMLNVLKNEFKIALLSRGYKRKTKKFGYVETTSTVGEVGDEPLQIKRKFPDTIVAVDADRIRGIKRIKKDHPDVDVVVLDDAFQHRRLSPTLSILLCDYWRPINKDRMLPWGSLRDSKNQMYRANIVIVTKCPPNIAPIDIRIIINDLKLMPYQRLFFTTFEYDDLKPFFDNHEPATTNKISAVAGIANPRLFEEYISEKYAKPQMLIFADHHNFSKTDMNNICKLIDNSELFITTEKDAMRLMNYQNFTQQQKAKMFYLPVKVKFLNTNKENDLNAYVINYIKKYKQNLMLYL